MLERKILVIERKISELSTEKQKITPFSEVESKNCSEFIREIFYQKIKKDKYDNKRKVLIS